MLPPAAVCGGPLSSTWPSMAVGAGCPAGDPTGLPAIGAKVACATPCQELSSAVALHDPERGPDLERPTLEEVPCSEVVLAFLLIALGEKAIGSVNSLSGLGTLKGLRSPALKTAEAKVRCAASAATAAFPPLPSLRLCAPGDDERGAPAGTDSFALMGGSSKLSAIPPPLLLLYSVSSKGDTGPCEGSPFT
jgi:hypothetical protein